MGGWITQKVIILWDDLQGKSQKKAGKGKKRDARVRGKRISQGVSA